MGNICLYVLNIFNTEQQEDFLMCLQNCDDPWQESTIFYLILKKKET